MIEKKSIIYLAIVLIAVLIIGVVIYFVFFKKEKESIEAPISGQEEMIKKQIEELDALRQQTNPQSLTQEEIDSQVEELEKLRSQSQ